MIETSHDLTIRRLREDDAEALATLAQRDSAVIPRGTVIGAFSGDGTILAAISLEDDGLVADPFTASGDAAALLRVHAHQMRGEHTMGRQDRRFRRRPSARTAAASAVRRPDARPLALGPRLPR